MELTHLSLFSGIGGLDLAAEWAGFKPVGQCEFADYPTRILEQHWPHVPRWRDIKTLTGDSFNERTGRRTVDVISGGFPCQPFSVAGKRRGEEDDRYLWPEMVRVIKELRPAWVVGENVAGIIRMALPGILSELEAEGYRTRAFLVPACAVGANHRRYRVAIVANAKGTGNGTVPDEREKPGQENANINGGGKDVQYPHCTGCEEQYASKFAGKTGLVGGGRIDGSICDSASEGLQDWPGKPLGRPGTSEQELERPDCNVSDSTGWREQEHDGIWTEAWRPGCGDWWAVEPGVGRVANGIPHRVDRIKCLGNAVVPQQFYPIFKAIAEIEHMN